MDFYYLDKNRNPMGPVPAAQLERMRKVGEIADDTLVAQVGSSDWTPYAQHPLFQGVAPPPPVPPADAVPAGGRGGLAQPTSPSENAPAPKSSNKGLFIGLGIGCLALLLIIPGGCAGFVYLIFSTLNNEEVKQAIVTDLEKYPAAVEILGTPVEPGYVTSGHFSSEGSTSMYEMELPVTGPKASGTLEVEAEQTGKGAIEYQTLILHADGQSIDLLKESKRGPPADDEASESEEATSDAEAEEQ